MLSVKALFVAPVLAAFAAGVLPMVRSQVAPSTPVVESVGTDADATSLIVNNCTYYNNAAHTNVVGQFGYDCCNNPVAWGKKTSHYTCGGCFPCFPPPQ